MYMLSGLSAPIFVIMFGLGADVNCGHRGSVYSTQLIVPNAEPTQVADALGLRQRILRDDLVFQDFCRCRADRRRTFPR